MNCKECGYRMGRITVKNKYAHTCNLQERGRIIGYELPKTHPRWCPKIK